MHLFINKITQVTRLAASLLISGWVLSLAGCMTPPMHGSVYRGDQLQQAAQLERGTVVQVRDVTIDRSGEGSNATIATTIGGLVGAAAGHTVGGGTGQKLATALGAAGGAIAGNTLSKMASAKYAGWEIVVQLESGANFVVVQEIDAYPMRAGQQVLVISSNGRLRVVPATAAAGATSN